MSFRQENIVCTYALSFDVHVPVEIKINSTDLAGFQGKIRQLVHGSSHTLDDDLELVATAQLFSEFGPVHLVPIHTLSSTVNATAAPTTSTNHSDATFLGYRKQRWDQRITFPCKYSDLNQNSHVVIRVYAPGFVEILHTTVRIFDDSWCAKRGRHQATLFPSNALLNPRDDDDSSQTSDQDWATIDEPVSHHRDEEQIRLLRLVEKNRDDTSMNQLPWLDDALFRRVRANTRASTLSSGGNETSAIDVSYNRVSGLGLPTLTVEFPKFDHIVVYETMPYPIGKIGGHLLPNWLSNDKGARESQSEIADPEVVSAHLLHGNNATHLRTAEELDANPVEAKYYKLARSMLRGLSDPNAKPNKKERERIQTIIDASTSDMKHEERNLLWQFRYSLVNNRKALAKVVCCVDWRDESECKDAKELLDAWKVVDIADALRLLCGEPEFRHNILRAYAIKVLATASNAELRRYLLQLVQALRYDVPDETDSIRDFRQQETDIEEGSPKQLGLLSTFLINRAIQDLELASYFHWYLLVDGTSANADPVFRLVHKEFLQKLESSTHIDGKATRESLELQQRFIQRLTHAVQKANASRERRERHQTKLRKLIHEDGEFKDLAIFPKPMPLPLSPTLTAIGIRNDTLRILASNTSPVVLDLEVSPTEFNDGGGDGVSIEAPKYYRVMFKDGDDLRQDQLVLQLIGLMDKMLKDVNMDLSLTLYRVLATSKTCGIMEFVDQSYPLRKIVHDYKDIRSFFRTHNQGSTGSECDGIPSAVLSRFIKSCAGYCVITYILGIGDRHLDNIMLKPSGQLFHIDFGYIFGKDPKPWPAPMRLTSHMIEAMGGRGSTGYLQFKSHCCQAYKVLRNNVTLIMNLLHLMVDAEIPDLSINQDQVTALLKIHDKFHLHLSDEEAEHLLLRLIDQSAVAYAPLIMDMIHEIAVSGK